VLDQSQEQVTNWSWDRYSDAAALRSTLPRNTRCSVTNHAIRALIQQVYEQVPLKRTAFEVMRRTVKLPRRLTSHLSFRGTFTVSIDRFHDLRLQHWGYMMENDLFWNGLGNGYEGTSLQVWRRLAPHASVILDVGANTGIYALVARCVNPTANIIALEPVERIFRRLQRNIELNGGNITAEQIAASDMTGEAIIYDRPEDHELTASLDPLMVQYCGGGGVEYTVPTKRLDDLLSSAGFSNIDLIKIDVELFEPQVLIGMGAFLSNCKPALIVEILNEEVARRVDDITRDLGYKVFRIVEKRGLVAADVVEVTDLKERNYLFVREDVVKAANIHDFLVR
jgi:FkbM family methyltransferase